MVSFSCENCGDVLTKKKLDPHRNRCHGASFTCIDCMVHFYGTEYRAHTSCISEAQKYQGALYKEKKPKNQHQNQKNNNTQNGSQALVPRNAYVEDTIDAETGAVAIVDAPPRAPSPPPAAHSLGYQEQAALPPVNVFDFLDTSSTPNASRVGYPTDESRMIEDSIPPVYEENMATTTNNGFSYGNDPVRASNERHQSTYDVREAVPSFADPAYTTPAPKTHRRTKSADKDLDTSSKKTTDRKRKRNSPSELDMELVRAQRERDVTMADAPPLHSGLTGGLSRLLAREFPPSPDYSGDYVEASPLSPMKRAKQSTSKALAKAQREWEIQQERERKAEMKAEIEREKERERGRERERKKKSKRRDDSAGAKRKHRERRRRDTSSSVSPDRQHKAVKAIEYHPESASSNGTSGEVGALIVRGSTDLAVKDAAQERAELFMSFVNKGPDSERGMSINKALKRYHRERYDRWGRDLGKGEEEKELWKSMRLRRNEKGEIVLFFAQPDV
ncbi:hypothetical protein GQ43DRAFT_101495 [Delitschia confertaspora ATCC 74209]|uniref:Zinc finger C2H2 LYAR-type domain-containing protein n=1 Tax=Delitschia confertaspora ATCC 74209 TaxID=1513339 RepID=A0A9P4JMF9_9PLEO|nr:hypothetical protein GQ43DRAFT_101495 [Delitschia confertaspora ATCC 74209]